MAMAIAMMIRSRRRRSSSRRVRIVAKEVKLPVLPLVHTAIRLIRLLALQRDWKLEADVPRLDEIHFWREEGKQTAEFDGILCCCTLS